MEESTLKIELNFPAPIREEAHFYGREDAWRQVRSCFLEPNARPVILLGERQVGKTSFLRISAQRIQALSGGSFVPVFVSPPARPLSSETFAAAILESLQVAVESRLPGGRGQPGLPSWPLPASQLVESLAAVFQGSSGKTFLLCLDGLDALLQPLIREGLTAEIEAIVRLLNLLIQERPRLPLAVYITSSRIPDVLQKSDTPNSVLEAALLVELHPFSAAESEELIRGLLEAQVEISAAAIGRLQDYTGGSPYLIKFFLDLLLRQEDFAHNPEPVSPAWIERLSCLAADDLRHRFIFQNIFERYFSIQERALALLMAGLGRPVHLNELALLGAQFITAANSLVRRAYLRRQAHEFSWRIGFIPLWLRHWERYEEEMAALGIPQLMEILSIDLWIDKTTRKVFFRQQPLELSNREYEVLECLCIHKGKLVSHDQIASHLWPVEADWEKASLNAITMAVSRLRKKLRDECGRAEYIETVVGLGYILHQAGFLSEQPGF